VLPVPGRRGAKQQPDARTHRSSRQPVVRESSSELMIDRSLASRAEHKSWQRPLRFSDRTAAQAGLGTVCREAHSMKVAPTFP